MSVGHLARLLEDGGIATVIIAIRAFHERLEEMAVPRALITPYIMGRPLGKPGDVQGQRAIIKAALEVLEKAPEEGTILEFTGEDSIY